MLTEKKAGNLLPSTITFYSKDESDFSHVIIDKEPWFIAKDICDLLELSNVTESLKALESYEKLTSVILRAGQMRKVNFINESGLYRLIFRSRKPEAKAFQEFVVCEVLPQIRKTGKYSHGNKPTMSQEAKKLLSKVSVYLVKGDVSKVAKSIGRSVSHVSAVKNGRKISHYVMRALVEKANENKKKGIQMVLGYSNDFVSSHSKMIGI